MVRAEIAAFHKRIDALTWMDPSTKAEAQEKLNTLYVGIGLSETWHDYSNFDVKGGDPRQPVARQPRLLPCDIARLGKAVTSTNGR